ncbi:hypothetical protein V8F20_011466 [Naviculisporaceae sp. PSN 640]
MGNCTSKVSESEDDGNAPRGRERDKRRREGQHRRDRRSQVKHGSTKAHGRRRKSQDDGRSIESGGPSRTSGRAPTSTNLQDIELQPMPSNNTPVPPPSEHSADDKDKSKRKGKQKEVIGSRPPISQSGRSNSTHRHRHHGDRGRSRSASGQAGPSVHRRSSHKGSSHRHSSRRGRTTETRHGGRENPQSSGLLPGQFQALPPAPVEAMHDPTPSILNHRTGPVLHPQAGTDDNPYGGEPPTYPAQQERYPHIRTPTPRSRINLAPPAWIELRTDSSEASGGQS